LAVNYKQVIQIVIQENEKSSIIILWAKYHEECM